MWSISFLVVQVGHKILDLKIIQKEHFNPNFQTTYYSTTQNYVCTEFHLEGFNL